VQRQTFLCSSAETERKSLPLRRLKLKRKERSDRIGGSGPASQQAASSQQQPRPRRPAAGRPQQATNRPNQNQAPHTSTTHHFSNYLPPLASSAMMSTVMCCGTNQSMTPTPTLSRDLRASLATSVQQQEPPHSDEEQLVPIGRSPMPDDVSSAVATAGLSAILVGKRGAEVETVSMLTLVGTPGCDSPPDSPRVDSGQDDTGDDDDDDDDDGGDDGKEENAEDKNVQQQPPDTRMVSGTRIWVAGYGEGRVEGFKATWIGANEHTVCFDAADDDSNDNDDSQATSTEVVAKRPKQMKLKVCHEPVQLRTATRPFCPETLGGFGRSHSSHPPCVQLHKMEWRVISVPAAAEVEEKQEAVDVEDGEADVACADDDDDGAPRAAAAEADAAANDNADEAAATGAVAANSNGGMDGADTAQGARIWVAGLGEGTVVSSRSTWFGATEHVICFPIADDNADDGADSARTVTKKLKLRKMKWRVLEVPTASEATVRQVFLSFAVHFD
jgi:hypothetical protein